MNASTTQAVQNLAVASSKLPLRNQKAHCNACDINLNHPHKIRTTEKYQECLETDNKHELEKSTVAQECQESQSPGKLDIFNGLHDKSPVITYTHKSISSEWKKEIERKQNLTMNMTPFVLPVPQDGP